MTSITSSSENTDNTFYFSVYLDLNINTVPTVSYIYEFSLLVWMEGSHCIIFAYISAGCVCPV